MQICSATIFCVAILLGNSIKLRAAITEPVHEDGDGPSGSQVCPMCCQGPAATPGIPGLPGNPGHYGPAGPKSDTGEPGDVGPIGPVGEQGATGIQGPKGNDGIGLPGKIGPRGPPGLVGPRREVRVKGQKGEPGETSSNSIHRVAFTVTRTSASDTYRSYDTPLAFEETETLLGTSFDLANGTFTCDVAGTYVFMFSLRKDTRYGMLDVLLRKNKRTVISGLNTGTRSAMQVSGSAVLVLQRGDLVYLAINGRAHSTPMRYISFSGFLLYPE